jgi:DUF4097 and DUF4098 domain-containing protein YvlB
MKLSMLVPFLALLTWGPVDAATPINESRPVAADAVIEVENISGSIRIRGSARSDVRITGTVGEGANGLLIEGDERRLRIKVDYPRSGRWGGWWGGGKLGESNIELEVPEGVGLKVESISAAIDVAGVSGRRSEVESVSGDITLSGAPTSLMVESVSGRIEVTSGGIREVDMESVSGRLSLTGPVGERINAESVSGAIRLQPEGALKSVQLSVVSGAIDLRTELAPNGRLNAESLSGELSVVLPRSTSARVKASSFSGSIKSDAGEVRKEEFGPGSSLSTTLGDGAGEIRLESFSGTLRLRLE